MPTCQSPHPTTPLRNVAHALLRAASRLLSTPLDPSLIHQVSSSSHNDFRRSLAVLFLATPLFSQTHIRLAAGSEIPIDATGFSGPPGVVLLPRPDGGFALAASLTAKPGTYSAQIGSTEVVLELDPPRPVPQNATRPPVILLNGYQLASIAQLGVCNAAVSQPHSAATFGEMEAALLSRGAPIVYFFDNCVEAPKARLEELGNVLAKTITDLRYADGSAVPQVDLVAHSMGGLIVRSYLAGLQMDGTLRPPANPRVRKYVQISTPNFGSSFAAGLASLPGVAGFLDDQVKAMLPASDFLLRLATQTGWGDDLRGVDALSIIANAGRQPQPNAGDGVVSLTSASLAFARGTERVRILPYCHTESDFIDCPGSGIAKAPETAKIVASFLEGSAEWKSSTLSKVPEDDPYLSQFGNVFLSAENAQGQSVSGITSAAFGSLPLTLNLAATAAFGEFLKGAQVLSFAAPSGTNTCGTPTLDIGTTVVVRCRPAPSISSVEPSYAGPNGRVLLPASRITITGSGFGIRCSTCTVTAGAALEIESWTGTAIVAKLPASIDGSGEIAVQSTAGISRFKVRVASTVVGVTSVINGASFQAGFAPGGWLTLKGVGLSRTTGVWTAAEFVNGQLPTTLDGVSVKINGRAAGMYYVSPTQLNILAPTGDLDSAPSRTVDIEVSSPDGITRTIARKQRFSPAVFVVNSYAAAVNIDGSLAAPANAIANFPSHPARAGDVLALYVTGLGAVAGYDAARVPSAPITLTEQVSVTLGDTPATVTYAGLVSPGLYQINFRVPNVTGNVKVAVQVGDVRSPAEGIVTVQ